MNQIESSFLEPDRTMNRIISPIHRVALWTACGLLAAACGDGASTLPGNDITTPLQIESVETEVTTTVTRALDATLADGKYIGVYPTASTAQGPAYVYVKNSGKWTNAGNALSLWNAPQQIYALYVVGNTTYTSIANNYYALSAETYNVNTDTYWAPPRPMSIANPSTSFAMRPIRSRLTIRAKKDASYPDLCQVTLCKIDNGTQGSFNVTQNVYSINAQHIELSQPAAKTLNATATDVLDIWMTPTTPNHTSYTDKDRTITMTIDGKTMTTTLPADRYIPKAGVRTIVTVTVTGTGLSLPVLSTAEWKSSSLGEANLN